MEEVWKPVIGWEGFYEVSSFGRVKNIKSKRILKQSPRPKGYVAVTLYKGTKKSRRSYLVHRLVAETFLGICELQVNHKDFNKRNNRVTNLEYCTNMENMTHAVKGGRYRADIERRKKKVAQIHPVTGETVRVWDSITDARNAGYISVGAVVRGVNKSSKGYFWRYV